MLLPSQNTKLVGHSNIMERHFHKEQLHHAYLLTGPRGIGKATLAYQVARKLINPDNPHNADLIYRLECNNQEGFLCLRHEDFKDESDTIPIQAVQELKDQLTKSTFMSQYIVLIDAIDNLSKVSQNSLLKIIEEPHQNIKFFLIHHGSNQVLPTIRSRCLTINMKTLTDQEIQEVLAIEGIFPESKTATYDQIRLLKYARGSAAKAIELFKDRSILSEFITCLEDQFPLLSDSQIEMAEKAVASSKWGWQLLRIKMLDWLKKNPKHPVTIDMLDSVIKLKYISSLDDKLSLRLLFSLIKNGKCI